MSDIVIPLIEWAVLLVGLLAVFLTLEFVLRNLTDRLMRRRQAVTR